VRQQNEQRANAFVTDVKFYEFLHCKNFETENSEILLEFELK
jgi:hypothetical protein